MATLTGPIGYPQATSVVTSYSSLTPAKIPLGTRARDAAGNEYVYVDFQQAMEIGEIGIVSTTFTFAEAGASSTGSVGVVVSTVASSDYAGWVQIYGLNSYVLATSATAVGMAMVCATTDGLSMPMNTTSGAYVIDGFLITTAPSTATSPSSITGVAGAWLNYPFVTSMDQITT